jgi:hypothetical protein
MPTEITVENDMQPRKEISAVELRSEVSAVRDSAVKVLQCPQ